MFKRFLLVLAGVALGFALTVGAAHLSAAWGLFANRDLNRSTEYMREVLEVVNKHYVDADHVGYPKLVHTAIHGMVESLDPHSEFLEARDYEELEEQLTGDFSGIGIEVELRQGHVLVIAPIANSPSERAGIQRGDEIVGVDGKAVEKGSPMDAVVDRLRGKPHTNVTVDLYRASTDKRFQLTLEREMITMGTVVDARLLNAQTGYIAISEFTDHTGEEFGKALDSLLRQGADSLVIDLRNNPGGLLDAAVAVAEPFFRKGEMIVYTRGRKAVDAEDYRAESDGEPLTLPTAVLINAATASAAEVVTGALKDTHRAVVVGERSFGKGSVQSVLPLRDGEGLRLTTARYYTPSGLSIHERGIDPDVEVILTADEDSKLRVQQTRRDITDPKAFAARFGFAPIGDRQLQVALDALRAVNLLDRRAEAVAAR